MAAEESLTKQLQDGTLLITPWGEIHHNPKQSSKPKPKPLAPKPTPAPDTGAVAVAVIAPYCTPPAAVGLITVADVSFD